ncbi:hypothetical protein ACFLQ0_02175 [Nitrospinota bacterium]
MIPKPGFRSLILGIALLFLAAGSAHAFLPFILPPREGPVGKKHEPIVEAIAAQTEIRDGNLWKIYIRASDPDGDLDKIQVTFSQLGNGTYSPDLLVQKKTVRNLNGAILVWAYLNGGRASGTIYGAVEIRVEDRAGNVSDAKTMEFEVQDFGPPDTFVPPRGFNASILLGQAEFPLQSDPAPDSSDDRSP